MYERARQELECCEVYHFAVCCTSMIYNVRTQGSMGSRCVMKVGGQVCEIDQDQIGCQGFIVDALLGLGVNPLEGSPM